MNILKKISHSPLITFLGGVCLLSSCADGGSGFDASGTFEADETIISSEASGKLLAFDVQEGQTLSTDEYLGYVDTIQLHLTKQQLLAQSLAVLSRKPDIDSQLAALKEQLSAAGTEQKRVTNLLESDAATSKQLDDINAQIDLIKGNIRALKTSLITTTKSLDMEVEPLNFQIKQLNDQLLKSNIVNPIAGTVLSVYAEPFEQVSKGQPLYKIANLDELTLRAYISGDQLPQVKLNTKVKVLTDDGNGGYTESEGILYWISEKAEFTPKTVQTKNERANKVYAIKVRVTNDGTYKIGMYGEVVFNL